MDEEVLLCSLCGALATGPDLLCDWCRDMESMLDEYMLDEVEE